jgi:hypothetical protein
MPHIRQDGQHGGGGYLAVACHIVDEKDLLFAHVCVESLQS